MNALIQEDIQSKIQQTEQQMQVDDAHTQKASEEVKHSEEMKETEDERNLRKIEEVNAQLDIMIAAKLEEENRERLERDNMCGEDLGKDDPMNSISGPKKVHYYGSPDDGDHEEFADSGSTGTTKAVVDNYNGFKRREDKTILEEIEKDRERYLQQGEYVYQLYSVLIHSGGVGGGHYSAYIKSFEDDQWYHFNDSRVSEIAISEIETMHGDGKSSRNAYLVIYKKVTIKKDDITKIDTEFKPVITDDQVPDYIHDEVKVDNDEFDNEEVILKQERADRKEKESHITLRVYTKIPASKESTEDIYSNKITLDDSRIKIDEKKIDFKNYMTLKNAREYAYDLYGFKEKGISLEDTQLRFFSIGFKVLKQTFEDDEDKDLKDLGISMATPLFLETKKQDEAFESLPANMIALRYYLWSEGIESIDEANLKKNFIFIDKKSTVKDLQQDILVNMTEKRILQDNQNLDNIAIFKERYTGGGVNLLEISTPDMLNHNLDSHNVMEGCRLFIDFRTSPDQQETNWEKEFRLQSSRY